MSDISDIQGKAKVSEWLKGMYSQDIAEQKSELKTLFTKIQDNELTEEQRAGLLESKNSLAATVEKLEAELAVLDEEMASVQDQIDTMTDQVAELVLSVKTKTENIETAQKKQAKQVVADVFSKRKRDPEYGVDEMVADMYNGMKKFENNSDYKSLQSDLSLLSGKESKIKELVASTSTLLDQKSSLEKRYGVTKSTYDLISGNLEAVSLNDANFTNSDIGVDKPIYSATKLETLVPYFDNTAINVEAGENSKYKAGTTAPNPSLDSINEKYKDYLKTDKTDGVDSYSYNNAAVQNLGKAIDEGLLTDLRLAGITGNNLVNFLTENFANANIKKGSDGKLKIPYGHGTEAKKIFTSLTNFVNSQTLDDDSSKWSSDYFKGVENTWDKNKGNTIDTNKQIKSLSENFDTIAADMLEKGFTFKEAMYAMFNPDNGLFKDSGITYDVNKQKDGLSYFIEYAGDDATASAYKNVAATIYKNWGVKPTMCIDYDNIDAEASHDPEDVPTETYEGQDPTRTDPLGFVDGDTEYTFIVDRDTDGRFDGSSEFLGGSGNQSWLDDLKALDTDGNGILEGDELKNLKILKSKIKDNAETTADGSAQSETTSIGYEFTNAQALGIERINLNGLESKVNQAAGRTDVNDSEVFNDSFTFTLNGKEVTARRKDDTDDYMNTVYGNTFGARLDNASGMTEEEIDNTIENDYKKFDDVSDKYKDLELKASLLDNFKSTIGQTQEFVGKTEAESDEEVKTIITRGQNKAQSLYGDSGSWNNIKNDVIAKAKARGIDTDTSDFLIQAEGIYIMDGTLSADDIVDKYLEMQNTLSSSETRRKNATVAFNGLIECAKQGLSPKLNDILDLMEQGKVTTVEDIVEHYQNQAQDDAQ